MSDFEGAREQRQRIADIPGRVLDPPGLTPVSALQQPHLPRRGPAPRSHTATAVPHPHLPRHLLTGRQGATQPRDVRLGVGADLAGVPEIRAPDEMRSTVRGPYLIRALRPPVPGARHAPAQSRCGVVHTEGLVLAAVDAEVADRRRRLRATVVEADGRAAGSQGQRRTGCTGDEDPDEVSAAEAVPRLCGHAELLVRCSMVFATGPGLIGNAPPGRTGEGPGGFVWVRFRPGSRCPCP